MERLNNIKNQIIPIQQPQSQFRYSLDSGILTLDQRKFYEENGFLIIKKMFEPKDMERWKNRFVEYCNGNLEKLPGMLIMRDISIAKQGKKIQSEADVTKIQDFQADEVLFDYCRYVKLIPYLQSFCGQNVKSVHTMFINKPPNMGKTSRHPLHQDLAYFPFRPADRIVAAWAALEAVKRDNGTLVIYPGSHKGEFQEVVYPDWKEGVNKSYFAVKNLPTEDAPKIHLEMDAGDVVFFHPLLIHGSGENKTQGYRKSICCHFASSECEYIDYKGTPHETIAEDVMSYASKKLKNFDYNNLWRFKCRLVTGKSYEKGI